MSTAEGPTAKGCRSAASDETHEVTSLAHCNEALIVGQLVTEPVSRALPSGTEIYSFSLTVRSPVEAVTSVPCVWFDPPKRVGRWTTGTALVVRGRVVRRFYRAGGATGSRTEVAVVDAQPLAARPAPRRIVQQAQATLGHLVSLLEPPT